MKTLLKRFWRDEEGQALPFFTVFSLIMAMTVIMNYNMGQTVSERMRAQCVADAAAYTGAVWQARFLNYCAYTRRAIIANWCNIAATNVMYSNRRMFERIGDESWFASDEDDGKEKEDDGMIHTVAGIIGDAMKLVTDTMVETIELRETAEQMNKIMSNSQVIMFQSVVNPEQIMKEVAEDSGQAGWPEEFEIYNFNSGFHNIFGKQDVSLTRFINPNMELDELVQYKSIPIDEVRWQFDRYTLPLLPTNGAGYGPVPGRKWEMHWYSCCANEPFYMDVRIKWAKPQIPKDPFQSKMGLLRPYADIMDERETRDARPRNTGRWITSHEGKGKHDAEPDDKKVLGSYVYYVKKCDKEYCFPEVQYEFYSGSSTEPYRLKYDINTIKVYEVKDDLDEDKLEPSVYCGIRRPVDQIGYLRLLKLENPHDIIVLSRAKLNFVSPVENLSANQLSRPNLNYPFWTASLAPITDGRNNSILLFAGIRGKLWRDDYFHNSFRLPYSMEY